MKKSLLTLFASTLVAVGCASQPPAKEATASQAAATISAAEHSTAQAAAVGYEWRDTGKLIKEAKAAEKTEDYAQAIKLAEKADQQGQVAVAQHAHEVEYYQKTHGELR